MLCGTGSLIHGRCWGDKKGSISEPNSKNGYGVITNEEFGEGHWWAGMSQGEGCVG